MPTPDKTKYPHLTVSTTHQVVEELDHLVDVMGPCANRHRVHLACLRLGMRVAQQDPSALVEVIKGA